MNAFIKLLYATVIAGAVVAFAGLTVFSFYQAPKALDYPDSNCNYPAAVYPTEQQETSYNKCQDAEDAVNRKLDDKNDSNEKHYQRSVTYILIPMALISLLIGVWLMRKGSEVIGEGLSLGAAAISIYAIISASMSDTRPLIFFSALLLLVSIITTAYFRFGKEAKPKVSF